MIVTLAIIALFGVLLVILETFVPGGIAGFFGLLCILAAVVLALVVPELDAWSHWQRTGLAVAIMSVSGGICLIWLRFFAVKFFHRAFTLERQVPKPQSQRPMPQAAAEGTALTELRPLGRADFAGQRFEVRCEDGFAPAGARLRVTGQEPGNLTVRLIS